MVFEFYLSAFQEKNFLVDLFQQDDPMGVSARAQQCHFPVELAEQIHRDGLQKNRVALETLMQETYTKNAHRLQQAVAFFKDYWAHNEKLWIPELERVIGGKMPPYYVLVTYFIAGVSDWYGTNIAVNGSLSQHKTPLAHVDVVLFEALLSHSFRRACQLMNRPISEFQVWAMAELAAFCVLEATFDNLSRPEKTGYEQVDSFIPVARQLYRDRTSFDDFLMQLLHLFEGEDVISVRS